MFRKLWLLALVAFTLVSCQFTESMVLNEDGSGTMKLSVDLSEVMAMSDGLDKDSTIVKTDTIIMMKDLLEARKDSISQLPQKEQDRLNAMKDFKVRMFIDPETMEMMIDVYTDFKNVNEVQDLTKGIEMSTDLIPGSGQNKGASDTKEGESEEELIGVNYSFKNGVFKRDAFIRNKEKHMQQLDSLKQAESFMSGMKYKLNYTFPKRIKESSVEDATFSLDGKTLTLERSYLEYFKNPDVLDLEVTLEK